jgi:hypothetical protein
VVTIKVFIPGNRPPAAYKRMAVASIQQHAPQGGPVEELDGGRAVTDERLDRRAGRVHVGKNKEAVSRCLSSGTVSSTASARNASVPSDPTKRRRKMPRDVVSRPEGARA